MTGSEYTFHGNPEGIECYSPPMKLGVDHTIVAPGTLKGFNYNTINIKPLRGFWLSQFLFSPISLGVDHRIVAPGTLKGFNYNTINIKPLRGFWLSQFLFSPISLGVNNIQSLRDCRPR